MTSEVPERSGDLRELTPRVERLTKPFVLPVQFLRDRQRLLDPLRRDDDDAGQVRDDVIAGGDINPAEAYGLVDRGDAHAPLAGDRRGMPARHPEAGGPDI